MYKKLRGKLSIEKDSQIEILISAGSNMKVPLKGSVNLSANHLISNKGQKIASFNL